MHDARAGLLRSRVATVDGVTDEEHLTREVDVVGAGRGAGFHQRHAVLAIRADRRGHDAAPLRQRLHRLAVGRVGHDRGPVLSEL
jgi:hypothetical protein